LIFQVKQAGRRRFSRNARVPGTQMVVHPPGLRWMGPGGGQS